MAYYLIETDDKGLGKIREVCPGELQDDLNDGQYGESPDFVTRMPKEKEIEFGYNADMMILIKGEIVHPKRVKVATEYRIE